MKKINKRKSALTQILDTDSKNPELKINNTEAFRSHEGTKIIFDKLIKKANKSK
jgi:hypothetical protein